MCFVGGLSVLLNCSYRSIGTSLFTVPIQVTLKFSLYRPRVNPKKLKIPNTSSANQLYLICYEFLMQKKPLYLLHISKYSIHYMLAQLRALTCSLKALVPLFYFATLHFLNSKAVFVFFHRIRFWQLQFNKGQSTYLFCKFPLQLIFFYFLVFIFICFQLFYHRGAAALGLCIRGALFHYYLKHVSPYVKIVVPSSLQSLFCIVHVLYKW